MIEQYTKTNINNTISPNTAPEKIETEGNIMKLISPENSFRGKDEIDINLNQNHIIGVSPAIPLGTPISVI